MNNRILSFTTIISLSLLGFYDVKAQSCEVSNDVATNIKSLIADYKRYKEDYRKIVTNGDGSSEDKVDNSDKVGIAENELGKIQKTTNNNITAGSIGSGAAVAANIVTMGFQGATLVNQNKTLTNLDTIDLKNSEIALKEGLVQGDTRELKKLGECLYFKRSKASSGVGPFIDSYNTIKGHPISMYGTASSMGFYYDGDFSHTKADSDAWQGHNPDRDKYGDREGEVIGKVKYDPRKVTSYENLDCSDMTVEQFISYAKNGAKGVECKYSDGYKYKVTGATSAQISNAVSIANKLIQTMNIDCSKYTEVKSSSSGEQTLTEQKPAGTKSTQGKTSPVKDQFQAGLKYEYCCSFGSSWPYLRPGQINPNTGMKATGVDCQNTSVVKATDFNEAITLCKNLQDKNAELFKNIEKNR